MSLLALAVATVLAATTPPTLSVRVYDLYGLSPGERTEAMAIAVETLADAGVVVSWIDCSRVEGRVPAACVAVPAKGEVFLRIQHRTERGAHILGTAIVQDDGPSILASIYAASVAARAAKSGVPMTTILGRVAAHEIGHLLLGSNSHSASGLMRPSWDVKWRHPSDWRFSRADAAAIRSRLRPGSEGTVAALVGAAGRR
jgi:hypothetical protein